MGLLKVQVCFTFRYWHWYDILGINEKGKVVAE